LEIGSYRHYLAMDPGQPGLRRELSRAEAGLMARVDSRHALARPHFRLVQPSEQAPSLKGLSLDVRHQPSADFLSLELCDGQLFRITESHALLGGESKRISPTR